MSLPLALDDVALERAKAKFRSMSTERLLAESERSAPKFDALAEHMKSQAHRIAELEAVLQPAQKTPLPRYPHIRVQLSGVGSDRFGKLAIVSRVLRALESNGVPDDDIDAYWQEALSGTYGHALATTMKWVRWQ